MELTPNKLFIAQLLVQIFDFVVHVAVDELTVLHVLANAIMFLGTISAYLLFKKQGDAGKTKILAGVVLVAYIGCMIGFFVDKGEVMAFPIIMIALTVIFQGLLFSKLKGKEASDSPV